MTTHNDIQAQKDFYDTYWEDMKPLGTYKVMRTQWILGQLSAIKKQLKNNGDLKLLDMGCGDGRLVSLWKEVTGADTYGIELSPKAVNSAQKRYPFVSYKAGDATSTDYESEMFDIVVCQEVLEHIDKQEYLVNECSRIIKEGGYLILTTPNKYYFDRRHGGNYSNQPIEQILDKKRLFDLVCPSFNILSYETLIYAKGDNGAYKVLTNRVILAILRRLGVLNTYKQWLLKRGYGLHHAVVLKKH